MTTPALACRHVGKTYFAAAGPVPVLHDISLSLAPGEIVALTAPSGAGKSTLLHIAGLLDTPTVGSVEIEGQDTSALSDRARTALRGSRVGFIYQFHHLLPELSARENALLPLWAAGRHGTKATKAAQEMLDLLGIGHRAEHRPATLSGGERQRVAVARALITKPALILADEPTGSLDAASGQAVFDALTAAARATNAAVLVATHNPTLAAEADRRIALINGQLQGEAG